METLATLRTTKLGQLSSAAVEHKQTNDALFDVLEKIVHIGANQNETFVDGTILEKKI